MKTLFFIAALPALVSYGCVFGTEGSGNVITETRTVPVFTGIGLQCSANVFYTLGEEQSLKVEAEDNIIRHITTEVKNDQLIVSTDDEDFSTTRPINVYVTVKDLCLLEVTGSGNITGRSQLTCENLTLHISGSGDIKSEMVSKTVKIKLSGSGNLHVSGNASTTDVRIAGSGSVDARNLATVSSAVSISGSGKSTINASEVLTVSITGSGDVLYVEEPKKLKTSITGSGNVSKI